MCTRSYYHGTYAGKRGHFLPPIRLGPLSGKREGAHQSHIPPPEKKHRWGWAEKVRGDVCRYRRKPQFHRRIAQSRLLHCQPCAYDKIGNFDAICFTKQVMSFHIRILANIQTVSLEYDLHDETRMALAPKKVRKQRKLSIPPSIINSPPRTSQEMWEIIKLPLVGGGKLFRLFSLSLFSSLVAEKSSFLAVIPWKKGNSPHLLHHFYIKVGNLGTYPFLCIICQWPRSANFVPATRGKAATGKNYSRDKTVSKGG